MSGNKRNKAVHWFIGKPKRIPEILTSLKTITEGKNILLGVTMEKNTIWKLVIQTLVTILTAIGTTLGVTSCL